MHEHQNRRVTRVITHVNFDKFNYEYDLALLKLARRVNFQPNIIPVSSDFFSFLHTHTHNGTVEQTSTHCVFP